MIAGNRTGDSLFYLTGNSDFLYTLKKVNIWQGLTRA